MRWVLQLFQLDSAVLQSLSWPVSSGWLHILVMLRTASQHSAAESGASYIQLKWCGTGFGSQQWGLLLQHSFLDPESPVTVCT